MCASREITPTKSFWTIFDETRKVLLLNCDVTSRRDHGDFSSLYHSFAVCPDFSGVSILYYAWLFLFFFKENCWKEIGFGFATIWLCIGTPSKQFLNHLMSSSSGMHNSYANFPAWLAASSICQDLHSYLGCLTQLSMNEHNFTYLPFHVTNISSPASACQVLYQSHQRLRNE